MDRLCGNETFWDTELTWDGAWPEFSTCFINTVPAWTPCFLLWIAAFAYLPWLFSRTTKPFLRGWLFWSKQISNGFLLLLGIVSLLTTLGQSQFDADDSGLPLSLVLAPVVRTSTMALVALTVSMESTRGMLTSPVLFLFWMCTVIMDIIPFYTIIMKQDARRDLVRTVTFYMTFALELFQLFLHSFASGQNHCDTSCSPETTASFPSWITYSWLSSLMSRGFRRELHEDDVSQLKPRDQTATVGQLFLRRWQGQRQKRQQRSQSSQRQRKVTKNMTSKVCHAVDEKTPLLTYHHDDFVSDDSARAIKDPADVDPFTLRSEGKTSAGVDLSLGRTLLKTFFWDGVVSNVWKLPHDILALLSPLLLGAVIELSEEMDNPAWRGYVMVTALGVSILLQALLFHLTFHLSMTLGLRVKSALTAAIFKKVLTVSSEGRRKSPEGEIINLVSVDTQHLNIFVSYLPYAWSGPIQIALSIFFLYQTVGLAAFVGAGVLVLLLPINAWLMTRLGRFQTLLMEHKDTRLKLLTDILTAIKTIKVYAWEGAFGDHVTRARERELHVLWKVALLDASQTVLFTLAPLLMSFLTFATHVFVGADHRVTSEEAFVTLGYLNVLRGAVTVAPMVLTDFVKAAVSLRRIERFLCLDDLDPSNTVLDIMQEEAVVMKDCTFAWEKGTDPCLEGVSLSIEEGSLVAVVGAVGSGKSSLLAAILGEMHVLRSHVTVNSGMSYVPQQPWLKQTTVRANIQGCDGHLNIPRYRSALRACALTSDLASMPGGDLTQIGDKGVTLSGGQRQRVSLARAVYESRDLYLMDDPLSAVDSRVGSHIFRQLIGQKGLLRDATRIVTTSTYHWLPDADVIVVLSEGRIVETGPYHELLSRDGHLARLLAGSSAQDETFVTPVLPTLLSGQSSYDMSVGAERGIKQKTLKRSDSGFADEHSIKESPAEELWGKFFSQKKPEQCPEQRDKRIFLAEQQNSKEATRRKHSFARFKVVRLSDVECTGCEVGDSPQHDHVSRHDEQETGETLSQPQSDMKTSRSTPYSHGDVGADDDVSRSHLIAEETTGGKVCQPNPQQEEKPSGSAGVSHDKEHAVQTTNGSVYQPKCPLVLKPTDTSGSSGTPDHTEHLDPEFACQSASTTEHTPKGQMEEDRTDPRGQSPRQGGIENSSVSYHTHPRYDDKHRVADRELLPQYDEDAVNSTSKPVPQDDPDSPSNEHDKTGDDRMVESSSSDSDDDQFALTLTNGSGDLLKTHELSPVSEESSLTRTLRSYSGGHHLSRSMASLSGHHTLRDTLSALSCQRAARGRLQPDLLDEEHVHVGKVSWGVYLAVARALGTVHCWIMAALYVLYHVTSVSTNLWLSKWTDDAGLSNLTLLPPDSVTRRHDNVLYLAVYSALGVVQCILVVAYALLLASRRVHASRALHAAMLKSILAAPLAFFHRNPAARVLSRMSRDMEVVDTELWLALEVVLDSACHVISTCVVVSITTPFCLIALLPTAVVYFLVQRYYVATSRQLRRLESKTRSPIFSHLSESLHGAPVLRAAGSKATERVLEEAATLVDTNLKFAFCSNTASRWLGVRMGALGMSVVGVAGSLGVALRRSLSGGMVGLSISYAVDVTENLNWLVRMTGDLETNAVSVERILEYSRISPESDGFPTLVPTSAWPEEGRVQFLKLSARHSDNSPRVLEGISCVIQPGEKVGVVGRTGAGKTSLWGVLVGLLTPEEGAVLIDGVDTRTVPLHVLRKRVAVMPQEPLILEGSLRMNLDPSGKVKEERMWSALRQTRLASHVQSLPGLLDFHCESGGQNLSTGQRQLLCLARILLRHARVLVLDEATASVDMETDEVIQQTIQHACAECTVFIVAHRLSTVMHCNRVMVLDQGRLVEMDSPAHLLSDPLSMFSRLAASANLTQ